MSFLDAGAVALDGESAQLSAMGSVAMVAASPPGYVGSEGRGSGSPGCHSGLGGGDHLVQIWRPSMGAPPPPPPLVGWVDNFESAGGYCVGLSESYAIRHGQRRYLWVSLPSGVPG